MTPRSRTINPQARQQRGALRSLGLLLTLAGLVLTVIGIGSFFQAFGSSSMGTPDKFWYAFVGLPLLGLGTGLLRFGYMGTVARFAAGETAPVVSDTVNYLGSETRETVRDLAGAVGEGLRDGKAAGDEEKRTVRERLEKLESLRRDGLIDEQDFEEQKDRILGDL